MKKLISLLLCLVCLGGCTVQTEPQQKQYTATFLTLFDTVTTMIGKAESEEAFQASIQPLYDELEYYHKLFDIYHDYDGINNLKTVNDRAGLAPVSVDTVILDLLEDCKDYYTATNGIFNPAMGSVLRLWHNAREDGINDPQNAYLPDASALQEASRHTDPDNIILDRKNSTVFFRDADLQLDVGGIAKGWAVERIFSNAPKGLLISVGGNIYATGAKDENGTPWSVGIQNPDMSDKHLHVLNITDGSVVTSGDYVRTYAVNGKLYHHIIDPNTLQPGEYWRSVTVVCKDSALADVLSTALFLLDRESGQALLDRYKAEAMWVDANENKYYSPKFKEHIRT